VCGQEEGTPRSRVEYLLDLPPRPLDVIEHNQGLFLLQGMPDLSLGRLARDLGLVERLEDELEQVRDWPARGGPVDHAVGQGVGQGKVSQVTKEAGLAPPFGTVELHRLGRLEVGGGRAHLGFPAQQPGKRTGKETDGRGTEPPNWQPFRRGKVDHASVDALNLINVIPNGQLAAVVSLDLDVGVKGE
jgi:hypothetical protein